MITGPLEHIQALAPQFSHIFFFPQALQDSLNVLTRPRNQGENWYVPPQITSTNDFCLLLDQIVTQRVIVHPYSLLKAASQYNFIHITNLLDPTHPQITTNNLFYHYVYTSFASLTQLFLPLSPEDEAENLTSLCDYQLNIEGLGILVKNIRLQYGIFEQQNEQDVLYENYPNLKKGCNLSRMLDALHGLFHKVYTEVTLLQPFVKTDQMHFVLGRIAGKDGTTIQQERQERGLPRLTATPNQPYGFTARNGTYYPHGITTALSRDDVFSNVDFLNIDEITAICGDVLTHQLLPSFSEALSSLLRLDYKIPPIVRFYFAQALLGIFPEQNQYKVIYLVTRYLHSLLGAELYFTTPNNDMGVTKQPSQGSRQIYKIDTTWPTSRYAYLPTFNPDTVFTTRQYTPLPSVPDLLNHHFTNFPAIPNINPSSSSPNQQQPYTPIYVPSQTLTAPNLPGQAPIPLPLSVANPMSPNLGSNSQQQYRYTYNQILPQKYTFMLRILSLYLHTFSVNANNSTPTPCNEVINTASIDTFYLHDLVQHTILKPNDALRITNTMVTLSQFIETLTNNTKTIWPRDSIAHGTHLSIPNIHITHHYPNDINSTDVSLNAIPPVPVPIPGSTSTKNITTSAAASLQNPIEFNVQLISYNTLYDTNTQQHKLPDSRFPLLNTSFDVDIIQKIASTLPQLSTLLSSPQNNNNKSTNEFHVIRQFTTQERERRYAGISLRHNTSNVIVNIITTSYQQAFRQQLYQTFLSINPIVMPILTIIKFWAKQRGLLQPTNDDSFEFVESSTNYSIHSNKNTHNNNNNASSAADNNYTLSHSAIEMMVFFFLQIKGILPILHRKMFINPHTVTTQRVLNKLTTLPFIVNVDRADQRQIHDNDFRGPGAFYSPKFWRLTTNPNKMATFFSNKFENFFPDFNRSKTYDNTKQLATCPKEVYQLIIEKELIPQIRPILPPNLFSAFEQLHLDYLHTNINSTTSNNNNTGQQQQYRQEMLTLENVKHTLSTPTSIIPLQDMPSWLEKNKSHFFTNDWSFFESSIHWTTEHDHHRDWYYKYLNYQTFTGPSFIQHYTQNGQNYNVQQQQDEVNNLNINDLRHRFELLSLAELQAMHPHLFNAYNSIHDARTRTTTQISEELQNKNPLLNNYFQLYNHLMAKQKNNNDDYKYRKSLYTIPLNNIPSINTQIDEKQGILHRHMWLDILQLVKEFFYFFAFIFNPKLHAISVRCGYLTWLHEYHYFNHTKRFINPINMALYIEDPFNPYVNLAANITSQNNDLIFFELRRAAIMSLQKTPVHIIMNSTISEVMSLYNVYIKYHQQQQIKILSIPLFYQQFVYNSLIYKIIFNRYYRWYIAYLISLYETMNPNDIHNKHYLLLHQMHKDGNFMNDEHDAGTIDALLHAAEEDEIQYSPHILQTPDQLFNIYNIILNTQMSHHELSTFNPKLTTKELLLQRIFLYSPATVLSIDGNNNNTNNSTNNNNNNHPLSPVPPNVHHLPLPIPIQPNGAGSTHNNTTSAATIVVQNTTTTTITTTINKPQGPFDHVLDEFYITMNRYCLAHNIYNDYLYYLTQTIGIPGLQQQKQNNNRL